MNRLKALYRSWAIPCAGQQVYAPRHRSMVVAEGQDLTKYNSLYDFVDAFGDIDLVALDEMEQNSLARILYQTVPFADCRTWDVQLAPLAEQRAIRAAALEADWLALWFDGREKEHLIF